MNANKTGGCASDQHCDSGRRNRFYPNKRTTPDTWQVEQDYQQQRRRLLNRAIHGWGVVYGFALDVVADDRCSGDGGKGLAIGPGLALDPCGRELVQAQKEPLQFSELLLFGLDGHYIEPPEKGCGQRDRGWPWPPEIGKRYCFLLKAHYAERAIAPVAVRDPCHCDAQEWDQVCETVRYSLTPIDCAKCCEKRGCDLHCECGAGECCKTDPEHPQPAERGGCRCLCEHLRDLPTPECCSPTAISDVLRVDLRTGVTLGCLKLGLDRCNDWTFAAVHDECGPRRLVKRNDLLFDLIRGCDLTRISAISWREWHRNPDGVLVQFDAFAAKFDSGGRTGFEVEFSRLVAVATINPDAFTMTVIARTDEDGWGRTLRVPIVRIDVDETGHPGYSTSARIVVDAKWVKGALDSISVFGSGVTRCEIQVRGDYLLDCNGQTVDANARGLEPAPTGNGTPGDTFFSTFLIARRKESEDTGTYSSDRGI